MATLAAKPHDPDGPATAADGLFGLATRLIDAGVVVVPVPFDGTTSYRAGASDGPAAILRASPQLDLFDLDAGRAYEAGICMLDEDPVVRSWNVEARDCAAQVRQAATRAHDAADAAAHARERVNTLGAQVNAWVTRHVTRWLDEQRIVGVVGGDHATAFGCIAAHAQRYPGLGVLHIDAHADLRHAYEGFAWSHASVMYNVLRLTNVPRLVQVGVRDLCGAEHTLIHEEPERVRTFFDRDLADQRFAGISFIKIAEHIIDELPSDVYVSFDIDGLDPSLCPNTGTPVPGGLSFNEAIALLAAVVRSGRRLVGFDLCEVAPSLIDPDNEWDGNVGARILYKLCALAWLGGARGGGSSNSNAT